MSKHTYCNLSVIFILLLAVTGMVFGQRSEEELLKSALSKAMISGDLDGAIADCTAAITLNPNSGQAYYTRGGYRSQKGDIAGAIVDFTAAIKIDPNKARFFRSRADAYAAKGNSESAFADYETALEIDPKDKFNDQVYLARGRLKFSLKDYEGSIADFGKAIDFNPLYIAAFERRAAAYRALGKTSLAEIDDKNAAEARRKLLELVNKPK